MRPPIIVMDETRIVTTFSTVERASSYMEDYDIAIYTAWDADGVRLTLSPGSRHSITLADSSEHDEAGLRAALARSLAVVTRDVPPDTPLPDLVALAHESFREDRAEQ